MKNSETSRLNKWHCSGVSAENPGDCLPQRSEAPSYVSSLGKPLALQMRAITVEVIAT